MEQLLMGLGILVGPPLALVVGFGIAFGLIYIGSSFIKDDYYTRE